MRFFCGIVSLVLYLVGIYFLTGKAAPRIKGYQALPEEEKQSINIKALGRNIGVMLFVAATLFMAAEFSEAFRQGYLKWAMAGWLALGCADVLFINKSKRYVKKQSNAGRR
ncbi:MAG: DUF3784 domain-containing protein [Oscillospiraceae bacterium]|nr:DUF3784 domain-containing protein [Oscillospiraceae bacterium]